MSRGRKKKSTQRPQRLTGSKDDSTKSKSRSQRSSAEVKSKSRNSSSSSKDDSIKSKSRSQRPSAEVKSRSQSSSADGSWFISSDSESQNVISDTDDKENESVLKDSATSKRQKKLLPCNRCSIFMTKSEDYLTCGQCKLQFHLACTSFNKEVYSVMKTNDCFEDVIWHCAQCKSITSNSNHRFMKILSSLQDRISLLEDRLEQNPKKTSVHKSTKVASVQNTITHQVIVAADNNESPKSFANKMKENLQSVPVTNFKVTKDGEGIINFPNLKSRDDGMHKLQNDFKVQTNDRPHRNLLPKVTIFNIDSNDYKSTDTTKLKKAICDKNPRLRELIDKGNTFDILLIEENYKQKRFSNAAVRIDADVYNAIQAMNFQIFIDFSRCHVANRFRIIQCYKCQKFGHMRKNCTSKTEICRFCSMNHESKNCNHRRNTSMYKCGNCGLNHSSTYYGCPALQARVQHQASRTLCMDTFSKNDLRPNAIFT